MQCLQVSIFPRVQGVSAQGESSSCQRFHSLTTTTNSVHCSIHNSDINYSWNGLVSSSEPSCSLLLFFGHDAIKELAIIQMLFIGMSIILETKNFHFIFQTFCNFFQQTRKHNFNIAFYHLLLEFSTRT